MEDLDLKQQIKSSLREMNEGCEAYYKKLQSDLLYESGQDIDAESGSDNDGDVDFLMYIRKTLNRIVNSVSISPYAVDVEAKNEAYEPVAEAMNNALDEILDADKGREASLIAYRCEVSAGKGYVVVDTDYISPRSQYQTPILTKVDNPTSILLDRLSKSNDGSDADCGAILNWIDKRKAIDLYGEEVAIGRWVESMYSCFPQPMDDTIPELVYYFKDTKRIKRYFFEDDSFVDDESQIPEGVYPASVRDVDSPVIRCVKYVGDKFIDDTSFEMDFIPIIPFNGDVTYVGKELKNEPRGLVYLSKPANQTANEYYKRELEQSRLAPMPNYMLDEESIPDGPNGNIWQQMHEKAFNFVPFKGVSDDGLRTFTPPLRIDNTPQFEPYMLARQKAQDDVRDISGVPDVNYGDDPSAQSGKSVFLRQKEGVKSTAHYQKNYELSYKQLCRVVIDLLGQVDTKPREIKKIDDMGQEQVKMVSFVDLGVTHDMFNINLTSGPQFEDQKTEELAMMYEVAANPALSNYLDLFIKNSSIPESSAIYERAQKMLPPELRENQEGDVPAEAREIMDGMQAELENNKVIQDQLLNYVRQLQNELQARTEEIQGKKDVERIKGEYNLAEKELDNQNDIITEQIKANASLEEEAMKQQGDIIKTTKEIEADLEKDVNNIMGNVATETIRANAPQPDPKIYPVTSGPIGDPRLQ